MSVVIFRVVFSILVITTMLCFCDGLRNKGGYGSKYETRGYKEPLKLKSSQSGSYALQNEKTTRKGLGLSAWGIIMCIVSFILAIAGMYYFSICYPIMCKKSRKYDMMGLTPVV